MFRTKRLRSILLISPFAQAFSKSLIFTLCCVFPLLAFAGEIIEEFDSPKLESRLWEVQAVGNASFQIKDGQLTMESPAIEDGILIRYIPEITGEDITFEFKFDVSEGDPSAQIWFGDVPLTPDINTDVNTHWQLVQTILSPSTYVKNAGGKIIQDTPIDPDGPNVYKFVLQGDNVTFFVNEEEIATVPKEDNMSYFHIGPDMYTSHYGGRIGILDYVKIWGPNVKPLAVEAVGKLAATWAELKK